MHYLRNLFTGRFGTSIDSGLPVSQVIGQRLPATLELAGYSFVVAVVVSVPLGLTLGVLTRNGRRRGTELAFTSVSVVIAAIPGFLLAVGLVYVFGVTLHWVPVAGQSGFSSYVLPIASHGGRPRRGPRPHPARRGAVRAARRLRAHRPRQAAARPGGSTCCTCCRTR